MSTKITGLIVFILFSAGVQTAAGQSNILFVYIGPLKAMRDSVLITTANPYDQHSKSLEGPHTKVYYTDQISVDSLRSFVIRSNLVSKSYSSKVLENEADTLARVNDYKIIGVTSFPLYLEGSNCFHFFSTGWGWGYLGKSVTSNAMFYLMFQCDAESSHNDLEYMPIQIKDPYQRLKDKPGN